MKNYLLTLLLLMPMLASAYQYDYDAEIDGIYYNLDSETKTAEVAEGENRYTGSVTIPSTVTHEGVEYSVTGIGYEAFYNCSGMTSIDIPNSVTSIGPGAFSICI